MSRQPTEYVEEDRPSRCSLVLYYTWKLCTCLFSHVALVSLVVAYCLLGAITFHNLESENELKVKKNISKIRHNVTEELWRLFQEAPVLILVNWTDTVKERLQLFETDLLRSMKSDGWDGSEAEKVEQWTFSGALFYSIIVITTIGYGHIAPKTQWGKVVTIFYAILGIPLMLLCLSNIGDIMAQSFRFLYWRVCCYICTRKPKKTLSRRGRSIRSTARQSGRYSGRSRTSSFKRSGRISTRSADSALGLSECMTRSSYSDTECRYNNDGERDAGTIQGNRASTHSRFSDTVLQVPSKTSNHSVAGKKTTAAQEIKNIAEVEGHISAVQTPVLFNKYALDRENTGRLNRLSRSSDQRNELEKNMQQHLTIDIPIPPPLHPSPQTISRNFDKQRNERLSPGYLGSASFSHIDEGSSPSTLGRPRIMSPMGFAISRQHSHRQRPTRLSRLREDVDYDDFDDYGIMSYDYEESSIGHSRTKPVPIWLCVFLVVTYILCGAALFMRWEGWSFLDSAYFCFITLTTIGFGDFVPARRVKKNDAEVSIALCSLYLLFGIALLAMSFNLVQEEVINNVKSVAKRLGIVKDDEEDDGE